MEILANLHVMRVATSEFMGVFPPNVYVLLGRDAAALVDTGYDKENELQAREHALSELGDPRISHIILTHRHPDHMGGAARLHKLAGGTITCSTPERPAIEKELKDASVGWAVEDGEALDLGGMTLEFVHTPGHTSGSMCVLWREERVLFTGDTILGVGTTVINPDSDGSMAEYLASLRRLQDLDIAMLCPGHGPVVRSPQAKIRELVDHRLDRERQVLDLLRGGPHTVEGLLKSIYPELDKRLHQMATWQVRAHLEKLMQERQSVRRRGDPESYVLDSQ